MNITALLFSFSEKDTGYNYSKSLLAANAVFCVITNFLLRTAPSLMLTLSCRKSFRCDLLHEMWDLVDLDEMNKAVQYIVVEPNSTKRVHGQRNRNLILVNSYEAFLDADIIYYTREYNFNEYYYIILEISDNAMKKHLQQILEYCWTNFIIHCSVQVQNKYGEVFVYTYFPYAATHCGDVVPVIINQFNGSTFVNPEIFPKKLNNMYQCPLRAVVWHVPPYMILTSKGNTTSIRGGIEGKLIKEIASLLNFTIDVKIPTLNKQNGTSYLVDPTTEALQMLTDGRADFSLGSLYQSLERNKLASFTLSYLPSKLVFFALRSTYDLSSWEILKFPFNLDTWLLILFTLSLALLTDFFANRLYKRCIDFFQKYDPAFACLNIFSSFLGVPVRSMPWAIKARVLFILWLFFSLVLRTLYQALLFHMIRTRIENKLPATFEDLANLNFTAVLDLDTFEALRHMSVFAQMHKVILNTTDNEMNVRYIEEIQSKWFLAVNSMDFMIAYVSEYEKPGIFKILPQELVAFQNVIYMPKHSFLIDAFNEEIIWLRVNGYFQLWRRTEMDSQYFKESPYEKDRLYGWKELHMIFVIYGVGVILACLAFILEIVSRRFRIMRSVLQII